MKKLKRRRRFPIEKLRGRKFGRLTIIDETEPKYRERRGGKAGPERRFLAHCTCGVIKTYALSNLTNNITRSCGCLHRELQRAAVPENAAELHIFRQYQKSAKYRGHSFDLSYDVFLSLTQKPCFYCGSKSSNRHMSFRYNGIDRSNNTRGYEIDNCVPCCKYCNRAKSTGSPDEFYAWIHRIASHLNGPNPSNPIQIDHN